MWHSSFHQIVKFFSRFPLLTMKRQAAICTKVHLFVLKPQLFALSINGDGDDSILNGENGKGEKERGGGDPESERARKRKKVCDRFDAASARKNPAIVFCVSIPNRTNSTIRKEGVKYRGAIARKRDKWRGREGRSSS